MRLLKRALSEWQTAPGLHLASTLVIALCVAIFSFFGFIYLNLNHFTQEIARELVLNIYLKPGVSEEELQGLKSLLRENPDVAGLRYLSSSEVLKELQALFDDPTLLEGVEPSFLPPVLVVSFKDPFLAVKKLPVLAGSLEGRPEVEKVQYARSWLMRLSGLKRFLELLSLTGLVFLGAATVLIVGLTVRFSLSERREELEILSLVGATPGFIQAPLLLVSFVEGLVASLLALLVIFLVKLYLDGVLKGLFPGWTSGLVFFGRLEMGILVLGVMVLCLLGSYWASRRYLRY